MPENPCAQSPCGPNALCQIRGESPACSCMPNYIGAPPNCRPECAISPECPSNLACINLKCRDPCVGLCGINARCSVINHNAVCSCIEGFSGDPFSNCQSIVKGKSTINSIHNASNGCSQGKCFSLLFNESLSSRRESPNKIDCVSNTKNWWRTSLISHPAHNKPPCPKAWKLQTKILSDTNNPRFVQAHSSSLQIISRTQVIPKSAAMNTHMTNVFSY